MNQPPYPVAITRCNTYSLETVEQALKRQFETLGGLDSLIKPGDRVLIKPNFIAPRPADEAAQTHTSVVLATARILKDFGARPFVGDSPAWGSVQTCARAQGLDGPLKHLGVDLVHLDTPRSIPIDSGRTHIGVSAHALDADAIFNLPKLKSHQQMVCTFAIKNMFGCISGKKKPYWHFAKGSSMAQFARFLIQVYDAIGPVLNVVDGIVAMDQDGPINGRARDLRWLIAGADPIAVERTCARLVGLCPEDLPIVKTAQAMQYGCASDDQIQQVDTQWADITCMTDFEIPELAPVKFSLGRVLKSIAKGRLVALKNRLKTHNALNKSIERTTCD